MLTFTLLIERLDICWLRSIPKFFGEASGFLTNPGRSLLEWQSIVNGHVVYNIVFRFESLTLSHNNMIALKPILHAWLEEAEAQTRNKRRDPEAPSVLPAGEKKRKRTSIAAPEKRSLEAYFAVQPRPSGEKIAAIAEKLDLKKNVVRVWFCNQRQKQKRMKFAAQQSCYSYIIKNNVIISTEPNRP